MKVLQTPIFKRQSKKLFKHRKKELDIEINAIVIDPAIGQRKHGDLSDVFVHKFKIKTELFLLAYTFDPETRNLIMIGSHENFYRDLKKYRR
ncbi:MAG: type II toxin-antitoxin system RelE/ParE family toxin [Candidatus Marinimicrobia bacterium]|nr:type II toxin-antitoxin system RelE/ParE family toxin [Candidatus Neomarinimicrobiota bacterium]MBL7010189.1 type II toxin-antitoxin system RelE/ParE family toxin [Candidatus Neomarinimicrobiota bacterium]MBL7030602.1 type II toxin-antitoxin system RelE/ParE family toxin [Candidatus Neomarinimicrobiota bacterium]